MHCKGLTIIELILVVAIIATLSMIAAPVFYPTIKGAVLEGEARKLMAELRKTQQQAISSGTTYVLVFNTGTDSIQILYLDDSGVANPERSYLIQQDVDLSATTFSESTLRFNLLGEPSQGGDITLNTGLKSIIVRVAPSTGKISIVK